MKSRRAKIVFGLVIAGALLWWALHDVSFDAILGEIRRAKIGWLLACVAVATLSYVPRAIRWDVLLIPVRRGTSFRSRFGAVCIGFMANNLLPVRLGEVVRAYSFSRVEPIGLSATLASLVVERVFDALVLATFLVLALVVPGSPLHGAEAGADAVRRTAWIGSGALLAIAGLLWLAVRFPKRSLRLFEETLGRLLPPRLTDRGLDLLAAFIRGLGAINSPLVFLRALAWSVVVWLTLAASFWLGFLAFEIETPGFSGALLVQAIVALAVSIPSSPGFFGPFEAGVRLGLGVYAVGPSRIVSFAISYHILTFIPITLLGLWYVHRLGIRWSEMRRSEEIVEAEVETPGPPARRRADLPPETSS